MKHASGQEVQSQQTAGGRVKRRRSSSTGVEDEDQEDVIDASTVAPSIVKKARRNSSPEAKTETSTQEAFSINKFGFIRYAKKIIPCISESNNLFGWVFVEVKRRT